jgi:hypothetical protein
VRTLTNQLVVCQIDIQHVLSCIYQLPAVTNDLTAHARFKNLQKQRYPYFTNANLQYEPNSGNVAFKLVKCINVHEKSGTRPLSELDEKIIKLVKI